MRIAPARTENSLPLQEMGEPRSDGRAAGLMPAGGPPDRQRQGGEPIMLSRILLQDTYARLLARANLTP
jgi:hypothetical protein